MIKRQTVLELLFGNLLYGLTIKPHANSQNSLFTHLETLQRDLSEQLHAEEAALDYLDDQLSTLLVQQIKERLRLNELVTSHAYPRQYQPIHAPMPKGCGTAKEDPSSISTANPNLEEGDTQCLKCPNVLFPRKIDNAKAFCVIR